MKELAVLSEHYRTKLTELSIIAYAEDLKELTPERLHGACALARQRSEFMPVSATILKADRELRQQRSGQYLGPRLLTYEEPDAELRAEQLAWQAHYAEKEAEQLAPAISKRIEHPPKTIEQQKRDLKAKGWLK